MLSPGESLPVPERKGTGIQVGSFGHDLYLVGPESGVAGQNSQGFLSLTLATATVVEAAASRTVMHVIAQKKSLYNLWTCSG